MCSPGPLALDLGRGRWLATAACPVSHSPHTCSRSTVASPPQHTSPAADTRALHYSCTVVLVFGSDYLAELYPGLPLWVDNVEEFVETLGAGILAAEELDRRGRTPCAAAPPHFLTSGRVAATRGTPSAALISAPCSTREPPFLPPHASPLNATVVAVLVRACRSL